MFLSIEYIEVTYSWKLQSAVITMLAMINYYLFCIWWSIETYYEDMVVISLIFIPHTVHCLWYINLVLYLSFDELIKGIISNWCQMPFKELNWEDMKRVLESSNSFIHHKIDWKNCKMDWFLISSTKIIFSHIITILIIFHIIQDRGKLLLFYIVFYIYELEMHYFSLIIIDSSFIFLLFYAYLL